MTTVQLYCLAAEAQLATPGARDGKNGAVCLTRSPDMVSVNREMDCYANSAFYTWAAVFISTKFLTVYYRQSFYNCQN